MRVIRVLAGLAAGTAAGLAVTAFNKNESKVSQTEFDNSTRELKQATNNLSNYFNQIKVESKQVKTIVDEVKTLISDFMKDIKPNINHIQENIEDLQKRGEVISEVMQEPTKSPSKRNITPYNPKTTAIGYGKQETIHHQQSPAASEASSNEADKAETK
ncbi:hypothetical protein [Staphylococcus carnosus]|uniref:Gas vesicle protein-protein n=2 Tax=Staphylococcus carnosus TaxID=1281 RepID=B9DN05_STACT|nr:hypothetical protein [Staphylococcus carnosus]ANZ33021.1 hypothetical protein BEK99_03995 [Staphylococcus carnosus]KKB25958.1 hypothetical protein VV61_00230 [Staphylococcus carnosus]QPT04429.1 hypothetical protein I6G40_02905 [Staphylococcus carnosus]QQS84921.1 hypothetical protein I6J04_11305 [Staphylococcus carnosus]QRQ04860.1 hypothetical protein I6J34_11700 [Staphylococcus carnosus]